MLIHRDSGTMYHSIGGTDVFFSFTFLFIISFVISSVIAITLLALFSLKICQTEQILQHDLQESGNTITVNYRRSTFSYCKTLYQ